MGVGGYGAAVAAESKSMCEYKRLLITIHVIFGPKNVFKLSRSCKYKFPRKENVCLCTMHNEEVVVDDSRNSGVNLECRWFMKVHSCKMLLAAVTRTLFKALKSPIYLPDSLSLHRLCGSVCVSAPVKIVLQLFCVSIFSPFSPIHFDVPHGADKIKAILYIRTKISIFYSGAHVCSSSCVWAWVGGCWLRWTSDTKNNKTL